MDKILSFSCVFDEFKTMRDGGNKLVFYTDILSPEDITTLIGFRQKQVFCVMGENPIKEIPKNLENKLNNTHEGKSPSQILRNVIYKVWENNFRTKYKQFEQYYPIAMEILIEHMKTKI